ncbi:MAG: hypothetical protein ABI844_00635 [Saprospiraceae bacterium]
MGGKYPQDPVEKRDERGEARPPARLSHSGGDDPVGRGTECIVQIPAQAD